MSGDKSILLWLLFLLLFALCALWYWRENRQLQKDADERLMRLAWSRTWQFLALLACSLMIFSVYDWQLNHMCALLKTAEEKPLAPTLAPPVSLLPENSFTNNFPTMLATLKSELKEAEKPIEPPVQTIDDVYNPEKNNTDNQSVMDDLKKRYEDILVNYIFLEKCGKTTANDYRIIMSALGQEMASVNAPGRLQYDIITAAQGSYKEIYATSSCEGDGFNTLYAQYTDYIKKLSDNFPAQ